MGGPRVAPGDLGRFIYELVPAQDLEVAALLPPAFYERDAIKAKRNLTVAREPVLSISLLR